MAQFIYMCYTHVYVLFSPVNQLGDQFFAFIRNLAVKSVSIGDNTEECSSNQNFFTASNCQILDNAYLSKS